MQFFTIVLANILGRPTRSLLTLMGVGLAVGAVVALVGIARGLENSLIEIYETRGIDLVVMQAGKAQQITSVLDPQAEAPISKIPGVKKISPGLSEVVSFPEARMAPLQGWPLDSFLFDELRLTDGARIKSEKSREILIGALLSRTLNKKVGDTLEVMDGEPFKVAGVFESYNMFENGAIIMLIHDLQEIMGREGDVSSYMIVLDRNDQETVEQVVKEIKAIDKSLEPSAARDFVESSLEIQIARASAWLTSSIALIIGAIGMLNTMMMVVFERTREIAMLRAIGWRRFTIMKMILVESLLLSIAGAVLGSLAAVALTWGLSQMPGAGSLVSTSMEPSVFLQGAAISLGVGLLGGLYPAIRAARLMPVEGLRHD